MSEQAALDVGLTPVDAPVVRATETEESMFEHLKSRFPDREYALLRHVANGTGSNSYRWADAIAMSLWPSRGLDLHGFEIKVSRSDWLTELKTPKKAEEIGKYCAFWWLVVPGKKGAIVRPGELPPTWGLMRWHGSRFVTDRAAPKRTPDPLDYKFLAAVLRRAQEQMPAEEVLEARYKQGRSDQHTADAERVEEATKHAKEEKEKLQASVDAFEKESGLSISGWDNAAAKNLGRLVREVRDHGAPHFEEELRHLADRADAIAGFARQEVRIMDAREARCTCYGVGSWRSRPEPGCSKCGGTGTLPIIATGVPS